MLPSLGFCSALCPGSPGSECDPWCELSVYLQRLLLHSSWELSSISHWGGEGVLALELASLPTTGVKIRLRNLYFYLCSEDPFLIPFSCGAICVGVSRQYLKNVHFQQTSSMRFHEFYLAAKEPPSPPPHGAAEPFCNASALGLLLPNSCAIPRGAAVPLSCPRFGEGAAGICQCEVRRAEQPSPVPINPHAIFSHNYREHLTARLAAAGPFLLPS